MTKASKQAWVWALALALAAALLACLAPAAKAAAPHKVTFYVS